MARDNPAWGDQHNQQFGISITDHLTNYKSFSVGLSGFWRLPAR